MQNLANEPLWTVDFATGNIINSLAAGDPIYNDDFTKVTIPLRKGVKWSDGVPFTADDVVFTVETLINVPGFNDHSSFATEVEKVYKNNDYEVEFILKNPTPGSIPNSWIVGVVPGLCQNTSLKRLTIH